MRFPRPRRDVLPDIEKGEAKSVGNHGPQDNTLLDLPTEIRSEVLKYLVSRQKIHLAVASTEEGAQFGWPQGRVKASKPRIRSQWCFPDCSYKFNDTLDSGSGRHSPSSRGNQAFDVLLVCRQFYHDTIHVIYSSNVFDFVDLLSFGDFATQFPIPLRRIRSLQARHKVPTLGSYSRSDPPAGLRAAVKLSWDGPAMFAHFVSSVMPQLKDMKLLFERTWMTTEYEANYSRRHAEWVRFVAQLAVDAGQPDYVRALGANWDPTLRQLLDDQIGIRRRERR